MIFYVVRLHAFLCGEVALVFCEERLHDFFVERLHDFLKKSCMIFVVKKLCDFFGGCMIFFDGEVTRFLFVEKLRFVDILHDFLCGEVV